MARNGSKTAIKIFLVSNIKIWAHFQKINYIENQSMSKYGILCFDIKLTHKWQFYNHFWPFLCKCMFIFHKTEIQTVILMCLMGLNSDWFKNYDTNCKYFHFLCLLHTSKKMKICIFCFFAFFVITLEPIKVKTCLAPQNDRLNLSFVKDNHIFGEKWPDMVVKWPYISCHIFWVHRTLARPLATSEAITFEPIKIYTH